MEDQFKRTLLNIFDDGKPHYAAELIEKTGYSRPTVLDRIEQLVEDGEIKPAGSLGQIKYYIDTEVDTDRIQINLSE